MARPKFLGKYNPNNLQRQVQYLLGQIGKIEKNISKTGGGGLPIAEKTGTTIEFTEDALYNNVTPLTAGNLTLDNTGALVGATTVVYVDSYIPTIAGVDYLISGSIDSTKLNLLWCTWDGEFVQITVINKSYLITPSFLVDEGIVDNTLSNFSTPNSTNYEILFNIVENDYADEATMFADQGNQTINLVQYCSAENQYYEYLGTTNGDITDYTVLSGNETGSASSVPAYNGTDTTYVHSGLTTDTKYIYFIKASSNNLGYLDSNYGLNVGTPAFGNTLLGGLAATYPAESDLATFLSIDEADITNYKTFNGGADISCNINTNYTLPDDAFLNNTDITYFSDIQGQCNATTGDNHFNGCTNLEYVIMNGTMTNTPFMISGLTSLTKVIFEEATGSIIVRDTANATLIHAPKVTSVNSFGLRGLSSVRGIYLPAVTSLGTYAFSLNSAAIIVELPVLTAANSTQNFYQMTNANSLVLLESVTTFGLASMMRDFAGELYIPNVSTNIGGVATDSNTFQNVDPTAKVYAHVNLQTNNGGGIDGDLQAVIAAGGTVVFITDLTPPDAVVDLAATNITVNSVDLTLTQPASTNAFQNYDVYVDQNDGGGYRLIDRITTTGDTISNLPSATEIKIKVKTVDEFRNRSGFSNEITFTTL